MKNSKGISLIALIITIIVIIILAAIVIGGVFNTPNDAKFANFCQEYDQLQTQVQLRYYDLYESYAIKPDTAALPTHYDIYQQVANTTAPAATPIDADKWVEITNWGSGSKQLVKPSMTGDDGHWYLRLSDGKIAFSGFEKAEKEFYYTPSVSVTTRTPLTIDANGKSSNASLTPSAS